MYRLHCWPPAPNLPHMPCTHIYQYLTSKTDLKHQFAVYGMKLDRRRKYRVEHWVFIGRGCPKVENKVIFAKIRGILGVGHSEEWNIFFSYHCKYINSATSQDFIQCHISTKILEMWIWDLKQMVSFFSEQPVLVKIFFIPWGSDRIYVRGDRGF